jgi:hypothetical protein
VGHDGLDLGWFGVQPLLHPWPSPPTGVSRGKRFRSYPERNAIYARLGAIVSAVMGGNGLPRAERKSLLSSASGSEKKGVKGRYPHRRRQARSFVAKGMAPGACA